MAKINKEIKRPICICGKEMTVVEYKGYYNVINYWTCENNKCSIDSNDLESEEIDYGTY